MPKAALDVGSNSIKVAAIDDDGRVLLDQARIVRLGEGLGDRGLFKLDRMDAALQGFEELALALRGVGIEPKDVKAVATSGARRALNAGQFFDRVRKTVGFHIQTVSGEEEALLTWLGARFGLGDAVTADTVVIDLGGGSTELIMRGTSEHTLRASLEIGAVRLTEAFLGTRKVDPPALAACRDHVNAAVATVTWTKLPKAMVAVGGTATTLMAMELGLETFDVARVHGGRLDRAALRRWIDRYLPATPEERRVLTAIVPERADYMLAGAVVLESCLAHARRESLQVSTTGLRYGLLA